MGRGNYLPHVDPDDAYQLVYVSYPEFDRDPDAAQDQYGDFNADLKAAIHKLLPASFAPVEERGSHDSRILHRSGLLDVCVADNEWSEAIFVCPRQDWDYYSSDYYIPNLAKKHLPAIAKRLFNGLLAKGYNLRVRHGAWMSGEYQAL